MNNLQRGALVALAVMLAVSAFLLLRPAEEPEPLAGNEAAQDDAQTREPAETDPAREAETEDADEASPAAPDGEPAEHDRGPLLTTAGTREMSVRRGDVVRFRVRASTPEEVHVHGYDIHRDVTPGETAHVRFAADLEGIFEIELHGSGTRIGVLRVEP